MADKLSYEDIESIVGDCALAILELNKLNTACNRIIMWVLLEIKTKAEHKLCGLRRFEYSFKLKPIEVEALICVRNELVLNNMLHSIAITRLLKLNKKK